MTAQPVFIERAVEAALKSSAAVRALCAGRVYPLVIPKGTKLPAVVYQRMRGKPDSTLAGYSSEGVDIMVNCFALQFDAAKELALAVRGAMAAPPLKAVFNGDRDLLNEKGDVFCTNAEYTVQQSGGYCHDSG